MLPWPSHKPAQTSQWALLPRPVPLAYWPTSDGFGAYIYLGGGEDVNATSLETTDPKVILHRVGNVLIVVGLVDILWMIYVVSSGQGYSSSFNIFAVIAGVLLRRNSIRTARVVRGFAAFMFAGFLGLIVALPVIFPLDIVRTFFRITPMSRVVGWCAFFVALLWFLWWVYRSLTATPIQHAITDAGLPRSRFWDRPKSGFLVGISLAIIVAIASPLTARSESAHQAVERAREQLGPGYRYFVSSLSLRSTDSGTDVRATVLAYTDSSIESVELQWRQ